VAKDFPFRKHCVYKENGELNGRLEYNSEEERTNHYVSFAERLFSFLGKCLSRTLKSTSFPLLHNCMTSDQALSC